MHELVVRLHHALLMGNSRFGQELGEFLFVVDVKVRSNLIGGEPQEGKKREEDFHLKQIRVSAEEDCNLLVNLITTNWIERRSKHTID